MTQTAEEGTSAAGVEPHSYAQILRSTLVIGGSTVVTVGFAILRNKAAAILLGPAGVGLIGLYTSILDLAQTLAGVGVQSSGVRQIAEAAGSEDDRRIALTVTVLRRSSLVLGCIGAVLVLGFAGPIAGLTFDGGAHASGVAVLSVAVLLRLLAGGEGALLQGMRKITQIARANMLAALLGTLATVPLFFFFGNEGIVPSLVAVAGISLLVSWLYSRRIRPPAVALDIRQMGREASALLQLGFAFMVSGLLTAGAAYAIRLIVLRGDGVVAAGLYQSAWALGGLYAGFILQAMGTDFYPRLTAVCSDAEKCNRLVNEQAQIALLVAGPGLLATLTFAPLVMMVFYSHEFQGAVNVLRWICLGMMLRLVAWPMGFIVVAKGARAIFMATEVFAACVHVGLAWLLVPRLGVSGAGIAFFGLYACHNLLIYLIVRKMSGFRWSQANLGLALIFLPAAALVFSGFAMMPFWPATAAGTLVTLAAGTYSAQALLKLLPPDVFPAVVRPWLPKAA